MNNQLTISGIEKTISKTINNSTYGREFNNSYLIEFDIHQTGMLNYSKSKMNIVEIFPHQHMYLERDSGLFFLEFVDDSVRSKRQLNLITDIRFDNELESVLSSMLVRTDTLREMMI